MSQSRLALLSLIIIAGLHWFLARIPLWLMVFFSAVAAYVVAFVGPLLLLLNQQFWQQFREARVDSSRVREALARIAIERWRNEAPIWGHGIVERGPHLVEYMPIGSHHTWYGLLFVKGVVGLVALAVPMLVSLIFLQINAFRDKVSRAAFCCLILLAFYTLGENLEILAYLIWPALLLIGLAHSQAGDHVLSDPTVPASKQEMTS